MTRDGLRCVRHPATNSRMPAMTDVSQSRRRWFRFRLRTLLMLLTVAAVGSWAYWYGWDRWQWFLAQRQLVAEATQFNGLDKVLAGFSKAL
jgi:hypothetical protein